MFKYLVLAVTLLMSGGGIQASTLQEPGFTEVLLANVIGSGNSFGSMAQAVDGSGNIYVIGAWSNDVYKVTPAGVVTQFGTTGGSGNGLGVAVIGDTLYVGFGTGDIRTMDLTEVSPSGVFLASIGAGNDAMGMAIAPAGFGAYGGQLVVGSYNGISIVHPVTGAVTLLMSSPGNPKSDVAFTPGGELLATDYNNRRVIRVSAAGTDSLFYAVNSSVDGIAVHPGTGEVYVADSDAYLIVKIAADGLSSSVFASSAQFDGGWFVSPLRFSTDAATLFYAAGSGTMNLYAISGFDGVGPASIEAPVPMLSAWALTVLTLLIGFAVFTSRRHLVR